MEALTIHPQNREQLEAVKSVLKVLKIRFEVNEENTYDTKFVERVLEAKEEIKQGKGVKIATPDLWK
jgi:hypothetical protein